MIEPNSDNPQRAHYEKIHADYMRHYYDEWSNAYRREFIIGRLLGTTQLKGATVAELACGDGHNSLMLRESFPDISLTGFDISPAACHQYSENVGAEAIECDLTRPMGVPRQFDFVFIVGGIHHCVADLKTTFANVAALVKPGGTFAMYEPSSRFFLEGARQLWYKLDKYFEADTEHALDPIALHSLAQDAFESVDVAYIGGPAYFLILNSLLFRLPSSLKGAIAPSMFAVERAYDRTGLPLLHPTFVAIWRRKS